MTSKAKFKPIAVLACMIMVIFALFCIGNVDADAATYSGSCGADGDNVKWSLDTDTGVLNISGTGAMDSYSRNTPAPWGDYGITHVVIENGVTGIGSYAFYNCVGLTRVIVPDSVTNIDTYAFYGCSHLMSVTVGKGVTSIADRAFYGCRNLVEVIDRSPLNITRDYYANGGVGYYAIEIHSGDSKLSEKDGYYLYNYDGENVYLVWYDGDGGDIVITYGVTVIRSSAFSRCSRLTSVIIPDSVKTIGDDAFYECYGLTSVVIGDGVLTIGRDAFYNCPKLAEVINHSTLDIAVGSSDHGEVGYYAIEVHNGESRMFEKDGFLLYTYGGVTYLIGYNGTETDIVIPSEVTVVYNYAFLVSDMKSVTVHSGVTRIGKGAFGYCSNLKNVYITDVAAWCGIEFDDLSANPVYYANGFYLDGEFVTELVIPEGVTSIGAYAFDYCDKLNSVIVPKSLRSVGYNAFANCSAIKTVYVSDIAAWCEIEFEDPSANPVYINGRLCVNGELVTEIVIPEGVTSIGKYAFAGFELMTSVTIPEGVTSIGEGAFSDCQGLTRLVIPDSVTSVGDVAFERCCGLLSVTLGKGVTEIGSYAFRVCYKLYEVINRSSLKITVGDDGNGYVGRNALKVHTGESKISESDNLLWYVADGTNYLIGYSGTDADLVFPESYNGESYVIADHAFFNREDITSVTIGNGAVCIGDYAFSQCMALKSVSIGDSVESIGERAFYYCYNLTSVTIPESVVRIGAYAFKYCFQITSMAFENTEGWQYLEDSDATSGTSIPSEELADASVAAEYLTDTYAMYYLCHAHSYTSAVIAPTCTEGGYTIHTCSVCGYNYTDGETDALGHSFVDGVCTICGRNHADFAVASGECGAGGSNLEWVLYSEGLLVISGEGAMEDYLSVSCQPYGKYLSRITEVVIKDGVSSIGRNAFYGFTAIRSVTLPESLMAIEEYAFFGCNGITSMTIPENVFYIGRFALRKTGITDITFADRNGWVFTDGTTVDLSDATAVINALRKNEKTYSKTFMKAVEGEGTLIVSGLFGKKNAFTWTLTDNGVLNVMGKGAMPEFNVNTTPWYRYRSVIRKVVVGEGITSVGRCSFHTCRAIVSVTLPDSLETISEYAFYNCPNLAVVEIPGNVTEIGVFAFRKCTGLRSVEFGVTYGWSAGETAFTATEVYGLGAGYLTKTYYKLDWVRNVNAEAEEIDPNFIAGGACNSYTKWQLVYIDEEKTQMKLTISGNGIMPSFGTGSAPWYGYADSIVEIEVCEGVTNVGRCAFYNLRKVTKVTLAEGITSIDAYAFGTCKALTEIEIPSNVTTIDPTAFNKAGVEVTSR